MGHDAVLQARDPAGDQLRVAEWLVVGSQAPTRRPARAMARLRLRDVYCVCLDSWDHMSGALLGVEVVVGGLESLASTLISFADKALELLLNHRVMVFPQFMSAQMAMSYLVESLLRMLDANRQAVGECRALLEAASRMPNERDALNEISELMPVSVRAVRAERRVRRAARGPVHHRALRDLQDGRRWRSGSGLRGSPSARRPSTG